MTADVRDRLRQLTEAHAKDKTRLEHLSNECAEASADADRQTAGMREVALFRAANAKAVMGGYAMPLIKRNGQLLAALTAVLDLADRHEKTARHRRTLAEKWQEQDRWQLASAFRTLARQSDVEAARIRAAVAAAGDQP